MSYWLLVFYYLFADNPAFTLGVVVTCFFITVYVMDYVQHYDGYIYANKKFREYFEDEI